MACLAPGAASSPARGCAVAFLAEKEKVPVEQDDGKDGGKYQHEEKLIGCENLHWPSPIMMRLADRKAHLPPPTPKMLNLT